MATRPNLDIWLDGSGPEHPVRVEMAFRGIDDLLDDLEQLLATLEEAAPSRLQGKRRDFRSLTDRERWFDLRSELLLAWWLSLQGVAYEFGSPGTSQPDVVLPDFGFGIEVTRRARDGSEALRMSLFRRLKADVPHFCSVISRHLRGHPSASSKACRDRASSSPRRSRIRRALSNQAW